MAMRQIGIYRDGGWLWIDPVDSRAKRASQPRVYIQTDSIDPLFHHAVGRKFDSKSAFRQATRDAGFDEIGDQMPDHKPPGVDKEAIKSAVIRAKEKHEWNN